MILMIKQLELLKKLVPRIKGELKKRGIPLPSFTDALFFAMGMFCGRSTLFGMLKPFGGAFFAAIFSGRFSYIYIVAAISGQIFSGSPLYETGKYIFAMTFFALITEHLPGKPEVKTPVRSWLYTLSLALSGLFFMFTTSRGMALTTAYDLMLLFLECTVAFSATAAFSTAIPVIKKAKLSFSFSPEEEIGLVSFLGCALWGAKDIFNFGIINFSDVICILIVLVFSIRLGPSRGVIAGLTMGLVSALGSGRIDISCVSYAFSALAASMAGVYGAISGCSAFILANALVTALANGSTEVLINLYDIVCACLLYALIPEKRLLRLTSFGSRDEKDRLYEDERCYSDYILTKAQSALEAMEKRMATLHKKRYCANEIESRFFERVARKGCLGCGMRRVCWSRDCEKTTRCLTRALTDNIETGKLKSDLLPPNCLRPKEFRNAFLHSSEIYRIEKMWQGKMNEVYHASQNRLSAFSEILAAAHNSLSLHHTFDRALADDIERRLSASDKSFSSVTVMRDCDGDPTVILSLNGCEEELSLFEKSTAEIISAACGRKMTRAGKRDCSDFTEKYVVKPSENVSFAIAGKGCGKKGISGDSVRWRLIDKALYAAVLCDGMGTGEKAAAEARSAAETLLDLIESGVDGEAAVRIVNSLFIPYGEATFSATDLYLYNTAQKSVKIIKCGGVASFMKSGERVDALYSKSLPLGSTLKSSVETFTLPARSGDITVMVSDGVLETSGENALKDTWLIDTLESFKGDNPRTLAESIVNRALEKCHREPKDDITVLAAMIK